MSPPPCRFFPRSQGSHKHHLDHVDYHTTKPQLPRQVFAKDPRSNSPNGSESRLVFRYAIVFCSCYCSIVRLYCHGSLAMALLLWLYGSLPFIMLPVLLIPPSPFRRLLCLFLALRKVAILPKGPALSPLFRLIPLLPDLSSAVMALSSALARRWPLFQFNYARPAKCTTCTQTTPKALKRHPTTPRVSHESPKSAWNRLDL